MSKNGILLLDKPGGVGSTRVLGRAKFLLGIRKAGHTGALDPMATGLLPLCFGEATKISGRLLEADKTYRATVRLGETTDTGDADGSILDRRRVPDLDEAGLEPLLESFRGDIEQVPPMYSALKVDGQRLHELARQGREVERKARPVTIHSLELTRLEPPEFDLQVHCSKGTYIRTLAMDIGEMLGCGAHLTALRRLASGPFQLDDAITLDALEDLDLQSRRGFLLPIESAFPGLPRLTLDEIEATHINHGRPVSAGENLPPGPVLLFGPAGLLALGEFQPGGLVRSKRLFHLGE